MPGIRNSCWRYYKVLGSVPGHQGWQRLIKLSLPLKHSVGQVMRLFQKRRNRIAARATQVHSSQKRQGWQAVEMPIAVYEAPPVSSEINDPPDSTSGKRISSRLGWADSQAASLQSKIQKLGQRSHLLGLVDTHSSPKELFSLTKFLSEGTLGCRVLPRDLGDQALTHNHMWPRPTW